MKWCLVLTMKSREKRPPAMKATPPRKKRKDEDEIIHWCRLALRLRSKVLREWPTVANRYLPKKARRLIKFSVDEPTGLSTSYELFLAPRGQWYVRVQDFGTTNLLKMSLPEALLLVAHLHVRGPLWEVAARSRGRSYPTTPLKFLQAGMGPELKDLKRWAWKS
jgi:hypothetical protein